MTKKHFKVIAATMAALKPKRWGEDFQTWEHQIRVLADAFAKDNPRFDRYTFVAACQDESVKL